MDVEELEPVLYAEPGSTWWPVLWAPMFALVGMGAEALTGPAHVAGWSYAAAGLAVLAVAWVHARRRACSVRLTPTTLRQGLERLPIDRVAEVEGIGVPVGVRVLGGGWAPPRGTTGLPLRLRDGAVVLAWAKDADGLRDALRRLLDP